jgi:hypothetical protein
VAILSGSTWGSTCDRAWRNVDRRRSYARYGRRSNRVDRGGCDRVDRGWRDRVDRGWRRRGRGCTAKVASARSGRGSPVKHKRVNAQSTRVGVPVVIVPPAEAIQQNAAGGVKVQSVGNGISSIEVSSHTTRHMGANVAAQDIIVSGAYRSSELSAHSLTLIFADFVSGGINSRSGWVVELDERIAVRARTREDLGELQGVGAELSKGDISKSSKG